MEQEKVKKTENKKAYMQEWRAKNRDKTKKHMNDFLERHRQERLMISSIKKLTKKRDKNIENQKRLMAIKNAGLSYDDKKLDSINNNIDFLQRQIDNLTNKYIEL